MTFTDNSAKKTIKSADTPAMFVPAFLQQLTFAQVASGSNGTGLTAVYLKQVFNLDVAAQATSTSNDANTSYWPEGTTGWVFIGNGSVSIANGIFKWKSNGASVTPGGSWTQVSTTNPVPELVNGPILNIAVGETLKFTQ